ncbi:PH-like domain-containing protein [Cellulomonas sp. URHB0016]
MTRTQVSVVVLVAVAALALVGMWRGWRGRGGRSQTFLPALPAAPADLGGTRLGPLDAVYVSTTRAGDWLDRVVAHGLGVRSPATVDVFDAGVRIGRTGAPDVFVPAGSLRGATTAPGMAGKFVGGDGLVVLTWQAAADDPRGLDTGLRPRHAADRPRLVEAVAALIDVTPGAPGQEEKP